MSNSQSSSSSDAGSSQSNSSTVAEEEDALLMLFIKERYGVSHEAYREMAKVSKHIPRQYQLQKLIKDLNKKWDIRKMPNDIPGVQQQLEPHLRERLAHLIASTDDEQQFKIDKKISVKLSGDGTRIGECICISTAEYVHCALM